MMTKQEALAKIEELKKYVEEPIEEQKKVVEIRSIFGSLLFQSTKTTLVEAIHEANSSGADLIDADLIDADLSDADLSGADLIDANLSNANLSNANLSDANLRNADLRGANLSDANLRGADLRDADLSDADLSDAELMNAKFYGRGGTRRLKRSQLPDFPAALGFVIEE